MARETPSIVDQLVENAADFIEHAIGELGAEPKYAVVHFYAGLEIFLKTRLAIEHWTLMYEDPTKANLDSFKQGDFRSVGMGDAVQRLNNILPSKITREGRKAFDTLRDHRNRTVHFTNPAFSVPDSREDIAAEQCRAWYELRRLLTETWKTDFSPYAATIQRLSDAMHKQRSFLKVKYERLKPDLDKAMARGKTVHLCPACDLPAVIPSEEVGDLVLAQCRVCGHEDRWLSFDAGGGRTVRVGEGSEILDVEDLEVSLEDLLSVYGVSQSPKDEATWPAHAYCDQCEHTAEATVVPWVDDDVRPGVWLCVNCLAIHDRPDHCEWCGEYATGEVGDYANPGCVMCGHHMMSEAARRF